jgi:hypothetical protein
MIGDFALARSAAAWVIASGEGSARALTVEGEAATASTVSVIRSMGSPRNTGPIGGVSASWIARRSAAGASAAERISCDHLVNCSVSWTMSAARIGSPRSSRVSCCPAVTSSGERARLALCKIASPLPTPGATCRLTRPSRPLACA